MSDKSAIEWTDATWNPIRGCTRVSAGCVNCYAEKVAHRFSGPGLPYEGLTTPSGRWNGRIAIVERHMLDPLRWKAPRRIFVNSMSDLFHPEVTDATIDRILAIMILTPRHTYQVLTKRPERMRDYFTAPDLYRRVLTVANALRAQYPRWGLNRFPVDDPAAGHAGHIWLGVSVEDQATANERIPLLLETPARRRWISAEPLLGPVDLRGWRGCLDGRRHLDWVVVGGESGHYARPVHPDWVRDLRDQCIAAGLPFFFKQWGEWWPGEPGRLYREETVMFTDGQPMVRAGKKAAGRQLDGLEWHQFPASPSSFRRLDS